MRRSVTAKLAMSMATLVALASACQPVSLDRYFDPEDYVVLQYVSGGSPVLVQGMNEPKNRIAPGVAFKACVSGGRLVYATLDTNNTLTIHDGAKAPKQFIFDMAMINEYTIAPDEQGEYIVGAIISPITPIPSTMVYRPSFSQFQDLPSRLPGYSGVFVADGMLWTWGADAGGDLAVIHESSKSPTILPIKVSDIIGVTASGDTISYVSSVSASTPIDYYLTTTTPSISALPVKIEPTAPYTSIEVGSGCLSMLGGKPILVFTLVDSPTSTRAAYWYDGATTMLPSASPGAENDYATSIDVADGHIVVGGITDTNGAAPGGHYPAVWIDGVLHYSESLTGVSSSETQTSVKGVFFSF